jgi:peptidoglycan hydrolase-like protein with peptidoglycan-binding domain
VGVRKVLLATVSVVALGLGGAGLAFAAGTTNSNTGTGAGTTMPNAAGTTQPGYNPGTGAGATMPNAAGTTQPSYNSRTGAAMGANTGTGTSGYNQGMNANTGMTGTNGSQWGGQMSRRDEVREVQQRLQADNLYSGKIDGVMGPETRQAVRSFQQQNGLRVNARLDRQTADAILGNGSSGQGSHMTPGTGNAPQTPPVPATR